jgi:hypothetical protein
VLYPFDVELFEKIVLQLNLLYVPYFIGGKAPED